MLDLWWYRTRQLLCHESIWNLVFGMCYFCRAPVGSVGLLRGSLGRRPLGRRRVSQVQLLCCLYRRARTPIVRARVPQYTADDLDTPVPLSQVANKRVPAEFETGYYSSS